MKECYDCKETKPLTEFYNNRTKKDGKCGTCKPCDLARTAKWLSENRDRKREYDARTTNERNRRQRAKHPEKYAARKAVNNAIRSGKLIRPDRCEDCGEKADTIHGHHEDYSRKLDVVWLCRSCHGFRHRGDG